MADTLHAEVTQNRGLQYLFTDKHHGGGRSGDAQWSVTRDEEFSVFNVADVLDIRDDGGRFYGVLPDDAGGLRDLGTWQQQIAEFPLTTGSVPWHGYPIWPVNDLAPSNRGSQSARPSKVVFAAMEVGGLITLPQRKRLMKGKHV